MSRDDPDIIVTCGTGQGPTELAAFDVALQGAAVADFNLIRLSSIIPPGSRVSAPARWPIQSTGWGDRLYAVYAEHCVTTPGSRACAGLGWAQDENTGAGIFVEQHGDTEAQVDTKLTVTLNHMRACRRGDYRLTDRRITSIACYDLPVAAVVIAAIKVERW